MYFFIGLGNPGMQYANTRHNVGWLFLDYWHTTHDFPDWQDQSKFKAVTAKKEENFLIKPQTFMNRSGEAVRSVLQFYNKEIFESQPLSFDQVFVIHDDLDIPFGKFKIQFGTGPKVHNGVNSVRQQLKSDQFWYIRIGVDGRAGSRTLPGHVYVLQSLAKAEQEVLHQVFSEIETRLHQELKIV